MSIGGIKSQYYSIAEQLHAPKRHIHFAATPQHDGSPHIETTGDSHAYVITERGAEYERRTTNDPEEIVYWLVSDLTWSMASDFELSHRQEGVDSRRLLFLKQIELLEMVKHEWSVRKQCEHEVILRNHPFADDLGEQSDAREAGLRADSNGQSWDPPA